MGSDFSIGNSYANHFIKKDDSKYLQGEALGKFYPKGLESPGLEPNSEGALLLKGCLEDVDCAEGFKQGVQKSALEQSLRRPH